MSVPFYIQQGPNPTWWLSPAIWVTVQGDPSKGPKVVSPVWVNRILCGSRSRTCIPKRIPVVGISSSVGAFRSPARYHPSISNRYSTAP